MKTIRSLLHIVLLLALPVWVPVASASSDHEIVARELERIVPAIQKIADTDEREATLQMMSVSLARLGRLDGALRITNLMTQDPSRQNPRDEVWRITARRLAWQGNIAAATRSANRIVGEYSQADARLALARSCLRQRDSQAALSILRRVQPVIEGARDVSAISHLAYLFARAGDETTARRLFAIANAVQVSAGSNDRPLWPHEIRPVVAYYQAKAGWYRAAIETAGGDMRALDPVKGILAQRRVWSPQIEFASGQPPLQATNLFIELALRQLESGDKSSAMATLKLAEEKLAKADASEPPTSRLPLHVMLAVTKVFLGEEAQGRAEFEALKTLPHFSDSHELMFHLALVAPDDRDFAYSRFRPKAKPEDEQAAIVILLRMSAERSSVDDLLNIARGQQTRGDISAMTATLQLVRQQLRQELTTPGKVNNSIEGRRMTAASRLLRIAEIEREAGLSARAQSTLEQAWTLSLRRPRGEFASMLLGAGFADEAEAIFEQLAVRPEPNLFNNYSLDMIYDGALAIEAPRFARAKGVPAALRWVLKIENRQLRAMALSGMAISQSPFPAEEREFVLTGDKARGASVKRSIRLPGYGT